MRFCPSAIPDLDLQCLIAQGSRDVSNSGRRSPVRHRHDPLGRSDPMSEERPIVYVIDDDESVREGVADLVRSVGQQVQLFWSAQEFLDSTRVDAPGCIVLDVRLPGLSGLEVQRRLMKSNVQLPIIFISGHGDIAMSVHAIKSGAIEFLTKPLNEQQLLDAIQAGIARDRTRREEAKVVAELQERFDSLTPREREILTLVVSGRRNRHIAEQVELSEMTVKVHRSHIMQKMRASSLVDLVRMADQLGVSTKAS
jgi:FixJ family two-component response regulator